MLSKRVISVMLLSCMIMFSACVNNGTSESETLSTLQPTMVSGVQPEMVTPGWATQSPTAQTTKSSTTTVTTTPKRSVSTGSLSGYVIGIDPGHQAKGDSSTESESPSGGVQKVKVSTGTQGVASRIPEYEVTLKVGLLLRDQLEKHGATVIMTRISNDVNISNAERAKVFNNSKTDYALRLHCNGSEDSSDRGAFMLVPTVNPFLKDCQDAASKLIETYCMETGAENLGITKRSDQTGFNWCERMIINIEMGHMTNSAEDLRLTDSDYQRKMAKGLLNGILDYFKT